MAIIRVKTLISMRDNLYTFWYPILLNNNRITSSPILYIHIESQCLNFDYLPQENFWILKSRKTIKHVLNQCLMCKQFKVKHTETPITSLPEDRMRSDI